MSDQGTGETFEELSREADPEVRSDFNDVSLLQGFIAGAVLDIGQQIANDERDIDHQRQSIEAAKRRLNVAQRNLDQLQQARDQHPLDRFPRLPTLSIRIVAQAIVGQAELNAQKLVDRYAGCTGLLKDDYVSVDAANQQINHLLESLTTIQDGCSERMGSRVDLCCIAAAAVCWRLAKQASPSTPGPDPDPVTHSHDQTCIEPVSIDSLRVLVVALRSHLNMAEDREGRPGLNELVVDKGTAHFRRLSWALDENMSLVLSAILQAQINSGSVSIVSVEKITGLTYDQVRRAIVRLRRKLPDGVIPTRSSAIDIDALRAALDRD